MLSDLLTFSIQNGLPQQTVLLLLLLPALAALVIFFRVVVGIGELQLPRGIFLTLGVGYLGLNYGLFIFFITLIADLAIRRFLEPRRLLPPAKHAISLFFISIIVLVLLVGASYFTKSIFIAQEALLILALVVSTEGLLQLHPGDHPLWPLGWLIQMVAFLYLGFLLITSAKLHAFILNFPLIFLVIIFFLLFFLARFRGLRVVEFFRFFRIIARP